MRPTTGRRRSPRSRLPAPTSSLLDIRLPRLSGLEVLRRLSAAGRLPPTIILTTFDDDSILEGLRAGAKGYLLKDVSLAELVRAIRTVAQGGSAVQPIASERVVRGLETAEADFPSLEPPDPLTEREIDVLRLMTGGYSNREIARALNVAEGTVKNHVSSILSKLGVRIARAPCSRASGPGTCCSGGAGANA